MSTWLSWLLIVTCLMVARLAWVGVREWRADRRLQRAIRGRYAEPYAGHMSWSGVSDD